MTVVNIAVTDRRTHDVKNVPCTEHGTLKASDVSCAGRPFGHLEALREVTTSGLR